VERAGASPDEPAVAPIAQALPTVLVAIASTLEERVRLAAIVGEHAPVLLVSTLGEAAAVLGGDGVIGTIEVTMPSVEPAPEAVALPTAALVVDSDARRLHCGERSVGVSPLEHDLLVCLLGLVGHTVSYAEVHRQVWGNDHEGGRGDVQSVVKRARQKLDALGSPLRLQVVRGVGLRLVERAADS